MKQCLFCLRPAKMTGEHLWSAWIGRLFSDYKGQYAMTRGGDSPEPTAAWKSKSVDITANVVCEECNGGWMNNLDEAARSTMKDMIRHHAAVSLLRPGIETIAAFAFKTAVVADSTTPNQPHSFFLYSERKRFAEKLAIPRGVQVWLSTFHGQRSVNGRFTCHYAKINGGRYKGFHYYVFTYVAGFLALQLTAFQWRSTTKKPAFVPRLIQEDVWKSVSIPLWPSTASVIGWPTLQYLDDTSIGQLGERFARLQELVR